MSGEWWAKRVQAVIDHVVGGLVLIGVLAFFGAVIVFAAKAVEGWEVIVLVVALVVIGACLFVLFRRLQRLESGVTDRLQTLEGQVTTAADRRTEAQTEPEPIPHPHAELLSRIDAFDRNLDSMQGASSGVLEVYNQLRAAAIFECVGLAGEAIEALPIVSQYGGSAALKNDLRAVVGQLRAIVKEDTGHTKGSTVTSRPSRS